MKHLAIHLKLLGMAVFWGASWPMGRMLGQALPPLTGGMLRFLTAAILLLGWLFARYRLRTLAVLSRKQWLGLALAAAFGVFGFTVLSMLGLQRLPASRATVLVTFNPVLTMFFAALLFGEKLNGKICVGYVVGSGRLGMGGYTWQDCGIFVGRRHRVGRSAGVLQPLLLGYLYDDRQGGVAGD